MRRRLWIWLAQFHFWLTCIIVRKQLRLKRAAHERANAAAV